MNSYERLRAKIRAAASLSRDGWAVSHRNGDPMWANDESWTQDSHKAKPLEAPYSWDDFWLISSLTKYWADRPWEPNIPKSALELLAEQSE